MNKVTVTYSLYGSFDIDRLLMSIESVKRQEGCSIDIIVAEQNPTSKLQELSKKYGFKLIWTKKEDDGKGYNPGEIRNQALSEVTTEYVYLNDADIVFTNKDYIANLVDMQKGDVSLILPPMRHLQQNDVPQFISLARENGLESVLSQLKYPNEYLANFSGRVPEDFFALALDGDVSLVERGQVYLTDKATYARYLQDESMKGLEPMFSEHTLHRGAIFGRTECMRNVGGYTNSYLIWGHEDRDLIWKLQETYGCEIIPETIENEVLHLDHQRGYFSKNQNIRNAEIFQERVKGGVKAAIEYDMANFPRKNL